MKPTTVRAAIDAGATVILRGHGRTHSPGATAFRLVSRACPHDPPGVAAYFLPIQFRDGKWMKSREWRGQYVAICGDECATVLE
jgi:hypothetical protein